MTRPSSSPIAVVGVAALFPGSIDNVGFWRDIVAGKDLITDVPPSHWLVEDYYDADPKARDKTYAKRGAFLPEVDFDALAWGVPPSIVPGTDTTQLLALIVAQRVLEDALGTKWKDMPRDRVSVILGVTSAQDLLGSMVSRLQRPVWRKALREIGLPESTVDKACDQIASQYVEWQESTFPGLLGNVVAGRIANRLDLGGTNCITDAACASSFSALQMAVSELRLGESDLVITGGADTMNDIFMYVCFSKTPALSPTGDCRPFSDQADGTMLGEGIGMVALKRLEDAERDGDKIYAVLAGVGSSSDGRSKSVYAPVASGQAKALRRAYAQAGYGPETVGLMEAHGTGTRAGDAAEFEALRTVFDESGRTDRGWCALGTVKSQVGHTKAASGAAGLFKAVMALHHGVLPPTIKVERPDPKLAIDESPFHLNTVARPWVRGEHPRRASVSSFGFGGSNFHITLQEYTGASKPGRIRPGGGEVVLLSASAPALLAAQCRALAVDASRAGMLAYLARSTQESFDASLAARLCVYAETDAELAEKLVQAAVLVERGEDVTVPGGIEYANGAADERVAFLFPGQGSQYIGMGADVTMALPAALRSWDESGSVALADERLDDVVFPRPAFDEAARTAQQAKLTATEWAQPALAATSLAHLAVLRSLGVTPTVLAGHSFGELIALHAAGVMSAESLLKLARRRGELMRETARVPGSMISVAASEAELPTLRDVVVANYNSPRQLVLSGATDAIEAALRVVTEAGLSATRLDVATAFHSPLVTPAVAPLRSFLSTIEVSSPALDVYANASAAPYPREADAIRDQIANQLAVPVRFVEQIEAMYARGVRTFVEVGAGRVLTNLVGHILKKRPHRAIALDRKGRPGLATLSQALGALSVAGVPMAYAKLWSDFGRTEDPRTIEKPKMTMKLSGANHGKVYPPAGGAAALPPPNPELAPVIVAAPVAATQAVVAPAADASVQLAWVAAFQETQRQTAEAHAAYQRSTAEVHAAFLRSADASLAGLAQLLGGALPAPVMAAAAVPTPPVMRAMPSAAVPAAPVRLAATPVRVPAPPARAAAAPVVAAPPSMSIESLSTLMVAIVAEKTGYPAETIGLDLDLEADLGVDSIKRVEILSATTDRAPGLPKLNAAKMATLRTLREIVAHLREHLGESPAPVAVAAVAAPIVDTAALSKLMLAVVAEKTGYPPETIGLDLDLEADLGVDSIKRVEILSATTERAPGLPKLDAAKMATLRTLRQIVAYLESAGTAPATHVPVVVAAPVTRAVVRAVSTPAVGLGTPGLLGARRLVVTDDGAGTAQALVALLVERGCNAVVVAEVPPDADAVILLAGLQPAHDPEAATSASREAFRAARAVARRYTDEGGTFVTVQDTGGDFGLSGSVRAWLAAPSALARTAALEWPRAVVRALDVERGGRSSGEVARVIVAELLDGGLEPAVGLCANGERIVPTLATTSVEQGALRVDERSVVVASGGARGVTAACLVELAKT
ncbi:MAG: beta-ketoacyl synthase N-terminal-like domain-containing protein, partial [Polyangia bacterium]